MKGGSHAASGSAASCCEEGRGGGRVAGEQGLGHGEGDAAFGVMVLAAVAAVGEVAGEGRAACIRCGVRIVGVHLNVGKDGPRLPRLRCVAELRIAYYRSLDFLRRFVHAAKLPQGCGEIVPVAAFARRIANLNILVSSLPVEGHGFFRVVERFVVQVPNCESVAACPATSPSRTLIASDFR